MTRLRIGRPLWLDVFAGPTPRHPSLHGDHRADVAIVGAGVTGCAAALLFARAGASVIVLEGARIGRGSTAASTALLMQEPDVDFGDLSKRYGRRSARRVWTRSRQAVAAMGRTLRGLEAPALHRLPSLYFTREEARLDALRGEWSERHGAGLPGRWLNAGAVRRLAGFSAAGGILTPGNAQVDPYRACLALASGAAAAGARLFERSRVTRVRGRRDGANVYVRNGRVAADWVVIATGYATPEWKPLAGRFRMMNTYVIATPRLTTPERRRVGLGDVMLWDTDRPYHYVRWTQDGRLLFGGRDRHRRGGTRRASLRRRAADLTADLRSLFPALGGIAPEYAWEGLFANTPDGLPYIGLHHRYPRQLFALGFGGNGMTFGFLAAQSLVRIAQGKATKDDELFRFNR